MQHRVHPLLSEFKNTAKLLWCGLHYVRDIRNKAVLLFHAQGGDLFTEPSPGYLIHRLLHFSVTDHLVRPLLKIIRYLRNIQGTYGFKKEALVIVECLSSNFSGRLSQ